MKLFCYGRTQQISFLSRPICWLKGHRWKYANLPSDPATRVCMRCEKREGLR